MREDILKVGVNYANRGIITIMDSNIIILIPNIYIFFSTF